MRFHIDPVDIQKRMHKRNPKRDEAIQRALLKYQITNPMEFHAFRNMLRELDGVAGD
jgi:hypothetical protein